MATHLTQHREGFPFGRTPVTQVDDSTDATGIGFSVLKLRASVKGSERLKRETAFLLMSGSIRITCDNVTHTLTRNSLFDEAPLALHASNDAQVEWEALSDVEWTVYETANTRVFPSKFYLSVENEHRGMGLLHDASYRYVRTIFDARNAPPEAELVLGEVVTFPGRWSSYPPHHHAQPEIYHYRFTLPQGYGHAELGDAVLKVRHNDTVKILAAVDHPQCAAPGYGMYYAWVIRHLPNARYGVPEFTPEHAWAMKPDATCWWPQSSSSSPKKDK